jgi:DNA topoisomerase IA
MHRVVQHLMIGSSCSLGHELRRRAGRSLSFEVCCRSADCAPARHAQDKSQLQHNLEAEARRAEQLVLWLDCDREGENIGFEVGAPPQGPEKRKLHIDGAA